MRPAAPRGLRSMVLVSEAANAQHALARAALLDLAPEARVAILMKHRAGAPGPIRVRLGSSGEGLAARLRASGGHLSLISLSAAEDTTAAVERYSEQHKPELVIIPRESKGMLARLIGGTPEQLARHGRVPVLIVQLPAKRPYRHVLVGIDCSEVSHGALELAFRLKEPGAEAMEVLHFYDASYTLVMHQTGSSARQVAAYYGERHHQAEARLRDFLGPHLREETNVHLQVRSGDPRIELEKTAREQGAELLVVGKHARQGLGHTLLGSVAEASLRRARCDVLIVPPTSPARH